jgi:hypothetical protein
MENEQSKNKNSRFSNKLDADPVDFGFTRSEIMKIRGYEPKKKKAKKNGN